LSTTAIGIFLTKGMDIDTGAGRFVTNLSVTVRIGGTGNFHAETGGGITIPTKGTIGAVGTR